jgi:hypothetical protein
MTQRDFEAGPEFNRALDMLRANMRGGEHVADLLSDLHRRVTDLENKEGGWRRQPPPEDDAA